MQRSAWYLFLCGTMPEHSSVLQVAQNIVTHSEKLVSPLNGGVSAGLSRRGERFGDGGGRVDVAVVCEKYVEDGLPGAQADASLMTFELQWHCNRNGQFPAADVTLCSMYS